MKNKERKVITEEVKHLAQRTSANRVAQQVGISPAAISNIINNKWGGINVRTWLMIENRLGLDRKWKGAETKNYNDIYQLLKSTQEHSFSLALVSEAGSGKSHAYKSYWRENDNVYYLECANYWSKREYINNLLKAVGIKREGTTSQMVKNFIEHLQRTSKPLVIIDQFDKLREPSLDLFMDFYNNTHNKCGFLLSGVRAMEKRIRNGVARNKMGYSELYSRIGRTFISLQQLSLKDVASVCCANGITDPDEHQSIYNTCEGDYRRIRRSIERYHVLQKAAFKNEIKGETK